MKPVRVLKYHNDYMSIGIESVLDFNTEHTFYSIEILVGGIFYIIQIIKIVCFE